MRGAEFVLVLLLAPALSAAGTVCVPDGPRTWRCTDHETPPEPEAPAVPAVDDRRTGSPAAAGRPPEQAPVPPVLLIDPERLFGPRPQGQRPARSPSLVPGQTPRPATPSAKALPVPAAPRPPPATGPYALQLARAASPSGFAALLAQLKLDPGRARTVRAADGGYLLLYGDYPDLESARAARHLAPGAFPRALAGLVDAH